MKPLPFLISLILFTTSCGPKKLHTGTRPEDIKQVIIFKFDDLSLGSQDDFQRVADIIVRKECKAGFGIIAKSCEDDGKKDAYYARVKNFVKTGRIEIWAHGYDHFLSGDTVTEFRTSSYQHQYEHFKKSLDLVQDRLGITMRTFGAPGNRSDKVTVSVINQFPQIEIFLFPFYSDSTSRQLLLKSRVDMERGTGNMNYEFFIKNYTANSGRPYMILQGHPGVWKEEGFEILEKIIDFLNEKGVTFMTAWEYKEYLKKKA